MRTAALPTFRKLYRRVDHTKDGFSTGLIKGPYTLIVGYSKYTVFFFTGAVWENPKPERYRETVLDPIFIKVLSSVTCPEKLFKLNVSLFLVWIISLQ